jgi:outer membrane receptor protein involved in Fe transport
MFMKPCYTRRVLFLLVILMCGAALQAQTIARGKVTDSASRMPIGGATVMATGSGQAVSTNAAGEFSLTVNSNDQLMISFVGYETTTVDADGAFLNIALAATAVQLSDVVVTALGVRKESKKIGYAVQEVKGSDLIKAREPNPINGLVGKVAGLTVGASAEMLQGPQLLLRGKGINLFVVDGVPINSDTWNISPDDVESYTVLKGPRLRRCMATAASTAPL